MPALGYLRAEGVSTSWGDPKATIATFVYRYKNLCAG
jgi:hypothetical protein